MTPDRASEIAERDQLWAALRGLRAEVDRLAGGGFDPTDRDRQLVVVLARIVAAELDFRGRDAAE
jgi:hypothetical protein